MATLKVKHRIGPNAPSHTSGNKYHDDSALESVLTYALRDSKTPSAYIGGIAVNPFNAEQEMKSVSTYYAQDSGVRLRHMILSFGKKELARSRGNSLDAAHRFAYAAAQYYGGQYQIVYAVHEDMDDVHIHFVMNTTNYITGRKYEGDKADLYHFIAYLNAIFNPHGVKVWWVKDDV